MKILGVDPGKTGGFALVNEKRLIEESFMTPRIGKDLDLGTMRDKLKEIQDNHFVDMVFIERVTSMPKQGVASMFSFGRAFGMAEGILKALDFPIEYVTPREWTRNLQKGMKQDESAKIRSQKLIKRLYRQTELNKITTMYRGEPRLRDGLIDAVLIAEFGLRALGGGEIEKQDRSEIGSDN